MGNIAKVVVCAFMMGVSCKLFFEIFANQRKWHCEWMERLPVLICMTGFILISFSRIPPYIFQPVRFILVIFITAQICLQNKVWKNLILSVLFCVIYWIVVMLIVSLAYAFPVLEQIKLQNISEFISVCFIFFVMFFLHGRFQDRGSELEKGRSWEKISFFPLLGMVVIMAISMMDWEGSIEDRYAKLAAISGLALINLCVFWYVGDMMKKEAEMQKLRLIHAHVQNQMESYRNMQKSYEKQRQQMHDYKNQLNCISGMISSGQREETLSYISKLTGSLKKNADYVNTNHAVVNVVLNQKYQEACEKDIVMTIAVNDLSGFTMSEEEIVTLLANLLDNAIEACEKQGSGRAIQFKMMLESGQLILSCRNPVKEKVEIKGKRVLSSKKDTFHHGIGLMNIDSVIRKNNGTSIIKCEDGWFYFSAMIPLKEPALA